MLVVHAAFHNFSLCQDNHGRPMRLYSTSESVKAGESSALAIAETMIAMAISISIGVYFDFWWHVLIGSLIAPVMLMRTSQSDDYCWTILKYTNKHVLAPFRNIMIVERQNKFYKNYISILFVSSYFFYEIISYQFVRFASFILMLFRSPIDGLRSLPGNWWKQCMCLDLAVSPTFLPEPDDSEASIDNEMLLPNKAYRVYRILFDDRKSRSITLIAFLGVIIDTAIVFFPAFAYRWSIKSTAIVWLPFLWAQRVMKNADQTWEQFFRIYVDIWKPQLIALYSTVLLVLFIIKYLLMGFRIHIAMTKENFIQVLAANGFEIGPGSLTELLIALIRPGAIPLWQIAATINSILSILLWWKIREWLAHYKHNDPPADSTVNCWMSTLKYVQRLLTSYSIVCNFILFWHIAKKLPVPEVGSALFPAF